jgi:molybdate transport system substrate-binding protein
MPKRDVPAGAAAKLMEATMTMNKLTFTIALFTFFAIGSAAQAREIKVLSSVALKSSLEELAPGYERTTGDKLQISYDVAAVLMQRIMAGERFDVAIMTSATIDGLAKDVKIDIGSRVDIARSGIGLAIRSGDVKPDITSVEAFKATLLSASSTAYAKAGASGVYFVSLLGRLGILEAMTPKLNGVNGPSPLELVANGKAQLGVQLVSEILATPGVNLVGPLPAELQSFTVITAAVGQPAMAPGAAQALIRFLKGAEAAALYRAKGMEPL